MNIWRLVGLLVMAWAVGCSGGDGEEPALQDEAVGNPQRPPQSTGDCVPGDIASYCVRTRCPASPDDIEPLCIGRPGFGSGGPRASRGGTRCGGTVVHLSAGLGWTTYYFDAEDKLIGLRYLTDVGEFCDINGALMSGAYGESCEGDGEPIVDLCEP